MPFAALEMGSIHPRIVEFVDELPKTIGGKIKRKEIRQGDGIKE